MMQLTIIGFGNQAKAWSQNLHDSGFSFVVALKPNSPSITAVQEMGFKVVEIGTAEFFQNDAFALLTPDHVHHELLQEFGSKFKTGTLMLYAHGYSMTKYHLHEKYPHIKHALFAPKSIGSELRKQYELKGKLGAVYSTEFILEENRESEIWIKALAHSLGITMGPYPTSFLRETQADLYSEQGLLCSIIPYTAGEMFTHLVESGIEPELAYFECWHELKLIVNAMVDKGPEGFFDLISPNALIGSEKGYEKLITQEFKKNLKSLLSDIKDESFFKEIDQTDVAEIRSRIRSRWSESPLMKTFHQLNEDV